MADRCPVKLRLKYERVPITDNLRRFSAIKRSMTTTTDNCKFFHPVTRQIACKQTSFLTALTVWHIGRTGLMAVYVDGPISDKQVNITWPIIRTLGCSRLFDWPYISPRARHRGVNEWQEIVGSRSGWYLDLLFSCRVACFINHVESVFICFLLVFSLFVDVFLLGRPHWPNCRQRFIGGSNRSHYVSDGCFIHHLPSMPLPAKS